VGQLGLSFNQMAERIESLVEGHHELFRNVSHELRTPLMRIQLALELLATDAGPAARKRIAGLEEDVRVLESLVEELLVYARLEPGAAALRREPVELDSLLGAVVRDAGRLRPDIRVDLECPPATEAQADARLMQRALSNLVANAVRHARAAVRVTVSSSPALTIDVDDDGAGVPTADRERIFEPFVRLESARSPDSGGAGLGLAIVRRVAVAHGASVTALDGPMGGARFRWEMER
jgi:two-component system sensor histidine kinase RstB